MARKKLFNKNSIIFLSVIGILVILSLFGLFKFDFKAEFFDLFGLLNFTFLIFIGGWMLLTDKETPDWAAWIVLAIGALGIFVDGAIIMRILLK